MRQVILILVTSVLLTSVCGAATLYVDLAAPNDPGPRLFCTGGHSEHVFLFDCIVWENADGSIEAVDAPFHRCPIRAVYSCIEGDDVWLCGKSQGL